MTDEQREIVQQAYDEILLSQSALEEQRKELESLKESVSEQMSELDRRQKELEAAREAFHSSQTQDDRRLYKIQEELDTLLYDFDGIVTQMRDGYPGPFKVNERIKELCGEAGVLIHKRGYAEPAQFDFFIEMMWQLSVRIDLFEPDEREWLVCFSDDISDLLMKECK